MPQSRSNKVENELKILREVKRIYERSLKNTTDPEQREILLPEIMTMTTGINYLSKAEYAIYKKTHVISKYATPPPDANQSMRERMKWALGPLPPDHLYFSTFTALRDWIEDYKMFRKFNHIYRPKTRQSTDNRISILHAENVRDTETITKLNETIRNHWTYYHTN